MRTAMSAIVFATLLFVAACAGPEPAAAPAPAQEGGEVAAPTATATPQPVPSPTTAPAPTATQTPVPPAARAAPSPRVVERGTGEQAPDFGLTLFNGESLRLSDLRGKVVVLNFWGSWCPPCRKEMPAFQRIWEEYQDKDVVFLGVAVSDRETTARAFAKKVGVTYPLGLDRTGAITVAYRVLSFPTTFVIGRQGNEAKRFGIANEGLLRIFLNGQLEGG